ERKANLFAIPRRKSNPAQREYTSKPREKQIYLLFRGGSITPQSGNYEQAERKANLFAIPRRKSNPAQREYTSKPREKQIYLLFRGGSITPCSGKVRKLLKKSKN
ncbi:MAG: hypothetical protein J6X69_08630, partial [Bacteroidales bacterium]|nr:hypothetical protein [Bacteroidales bacterium]